MESQARKEESLLAKAIFILLIVLLSLVVYSLHDSDPFGNSLHGWNDSWYSIAARNYLKYGVFRLKGMMVIKCGEVYKDFNFYKGHPPLAGLLTALVYWGFGEGEARVRWPAASLTILSSIFLFLFLCSWYRRPLPAFLTFLLTFFSPLLLFYGNMMDPQGAGVMLSMNGALWASINLVRGRRKTLFFMILNIFMVFGYFFDWPAYYFGFLLGIYFILFRQSKFLKNTSTWIS